MVALSEMLLVPCAGLEIQAELWSPNVWMRWAGRRSLGLSRTGEPFGTGGACAEKMGST